MSQKMLIMVKMVNCDFGDNDSHLVLVEIVSVRTVETVLMNVPVTSNWPQQCCMKQFVNLVGADMVYLMKKTVIESSERTSNLGSFYLCSKIAHV